LANDINTPKALGALQQWISQTNSGGTGGKPGELSRAIDTLLGIAI
jgi:L-cysteine:1D-myo-inositol 2-amino-2-deoxy-alpha-D-glucopyranoside ligase